MMDPNDHFTDGMGWWSISGEALMDMLKRCYNGDSPDVVYAEEYANSEVQRFCCCKNHEHEGAETCANCGCLAAPVDDRREERMGLSLLGCALGMIEDYLEKKGGDRVGLESVRSVREGIERKMKDD